MAETELGPIDDPQVGDVAIRRRGRKKVTVTKVCRFLAGDISYIHVRFENGREKEIVLFEWKVEYRDHQRPVS